MTDQLDKPLTCRMATVRHLGPEAIRVLDSLHEESETRPPHDRLVDSGGEAPAFLLTEGWAYVFRALRDGRRQILGLLTPGEIANPEGLIGESAAAAVRTLTPVSCVALGRDDLDTVTAADPVLARELTWRLGAAAIDAEHLLSLGRRSAHERIAHFLLDTWDRLATIDMVNGTHYRLPAKQEHIADLLGLSVVHVSRTLTQMRDQGLARVERGTAKLDDMPGLMEAADIQLHNPLPASVLGGVPARAA